MHVPKTSGTALGLMLGDAFGAGLVTDYDDDPANQLSPRNLDPQRYLLRAHQAPSHARCLHGHYHPAKYALHADDYLFTMLREPVENIISIYFFWKSLPRSNSPLHCYFLDNRLSLMETARLPLLQRLFSYTYFGGFDMARFNLIGRFDARTSAFARLGSDLGIAIDGGARINETPPSLERRDVEADRRIQSQLRDVLADDICFYEAHAR